jgi:hypothetical protein
MSNKISYEEFCSKLPEDIRTDQQRLMNVCRAANVDVPLLERFYTKQHTPKPNRFEQNPTETSFVVVPGKGRHNLWVRNQDYAEFVAAVVAYGRQKGLLTE